MLRELGNEIIELFKEGKVKDVQINGLKAEVESLKAGVEALNIQISQLEQEKEIVLQSIRDKENIINSLNAQTVELQGQIENLTNVLNSKNEENRLLKEQTVKLRSELDVKVKEVVDKDYLIAEQEKEINTKGLKVAELQAQADLKLDEVKNIVEDLKGLIANA